MTRRVVPIYDKAGKLKDLTTRKTRRGSKLTRSELDDLEEHVRRRSAEGGFTNLWNSDALKLIAHIRAQDVALREIAERGHYDGCRVSEAMETCERNTPRGKVVEAHNHEDAGCDCPVGIARDRVMKDE